MKILYYLAPDLELHDPMFRYGTYKGLLLPEIRKLLDACSGFDVGMVLSSQLHAQAQNDHQTDDRIHYFPYANCPHFDDAAVFRGKVDPGQFNEHQENLKNLTRGFDPDLVLVYEKPAPWLAECFSSARIVNVMFGALSRAPFPALAAFDPQGIYSQSLLITEQERIRAHPLTAADQRALNKLRRTWSKALSDYQPFRSAIANLHQKFRRLVMVCCQVNDHYAVTGTSDFESQFHMVERVCESASDDTGIILTQHPYRPALSGDQVLKLQQRYPNLVPFRSVQNIPDVSQFLMPYMDAMVTVSSSLAWQAALWRVPVLAAGNSQINLIASGSIEQLKPVLEGQLETDFAAIDRALAFVLFRYNRHYRTDIFNGRRYAQFLKDFHASLNEDPSGKDWFFGRKIGVGRKYGSLARATRAWELRDWFSARPDIEVGDKLMGLIAQHRVVSYDLFDTLVDRPFAEPHELFKLLEPRVQKLLGNRFFPFHKLRRQAEADVRRPTEGKYEVTLDQIYGRLAELGSLTAAQSRVIKQLELDAELSACRLKRTMRPYWRQARLLADQLLIISDYYIEQDELVPLLKREGIEPDQFHVSASRSLRKHDGQLFDAILHELQSKNNLTARDWLHIGDNPRADRDMADRRGIRSYKFQRGDENLSGSALGEVLLQSRKMPGLSASVITGLLASKMTSAPWTQTSRNDWFRGDPYYLGYAAFGPLVVGFSQWIEWESRTQGFDHLYFLARDGQIVKSVHETLFGSSDKLSYLLASRRAVTVASLKTIDDAIELAYQSFNSQSLADFLLNRFGFVLQRKHEAALKKVGLKPGSIVSSGADMPRLIELFRLIEPDLLEHAATERKAYTKYLESLDLPRRAKEEKIAVVDIGYSGSMQHHLLKLFPDTRISGLYMLTHQHARPQFDGQIFRAYLADLDDHRIGVRHKLNDHVFVFETGMSSLEGSLNNMSLNAQGEPEAHFLHAETEESRKVLLARIHRGITDFARDFKQRLGSHSDAFALSPALAEYLLLKFCDQPTATDAAIFEGCEVENLFGGGTACLIEPRKPMQILPSLRNAQLNGLIERSKWKPGARALVAADRPNRASAGVASGHANQALAEQEKGAAVSRSKARWQRKLAKLANKPQQFFEDSRLAPLRPLRHLFGDGPIGSFNRRMIKRLAG